jgi:hypothetical protein
MPFLTVLQLKETVVQMLKTHILGDRVTHPDDIYSEEDESISEQSIDDASEHNAYAQPEVKNFSRDFYSPPFNPGVNMNHRK